VSFVLSLGAQNRRRHFHVLSGGYVTRKFRSTSWLASRHRATEFVIGGLLVAYVFYVLMLSKFFSPSVEQSWFRDLGILWMLSDYVFEHHRYPPHGYFFPPPNAVIVHAFGLIDRELAFRLYLMIQIFCGALLLWMWSRCLGLPKRPDRLLIVLVAILASLRYVHIELAMHNVNLLTLALVSGAVLFHRDRPAGFFYALSLAIKPYSSVLVLPWMVWRGYFSWATHAVLWLLVFFLALPVLCFGVSDTGVLYRDWIEALTVANIDHATGLSVRAGLATLFNLPVTDPLVAQVNTIAIGLWIAAILLFFAPTLIRRSPASSSTIATELAAILLTALPVGALQQPARGVAILIAMLVIAAAAFADGTSPRSRIALLAVLAFVGISSQMVPMGPLFALLTLPICLAAVAGLAIVRYESSRRRRPSLSKQATSSAICP
jgi:Glycosyltransferase family 87